MFCNIGRFVIVPFVALGVLLHWAFFNWGFCFWGFVTLGVLLWAFCIQSNLILSFNNINKMKKENILR